MHQHSHNHAHSHTPGNAINSKAYIWGIALNAVYIIAEAVAGFMTNSMSLLTDAGHNLSDVAGLALSLLAFRLARAKPTQSFTYGYKKTTILAALANAVILLLAIGTLGYESISRLRRPQPVAGSAIAWVAGIGIIINVVSALLFFRDKDHELNAKGAYLHLMSDAVISLGVVVAGIVINYTSWYWLDPAVSLGVLIVILLGTWSLLTDSLRLSLDAVPRSVDPVEIENIIKQVTDVEAVHHIHIWAMSTTENALTAHVVLNKQLKFEEKRAVVHHIKHELQHHDIQHATIEIEIAEDDCADVDC